MGGCWWLLNFNLFLEDEYDLKFRTLSEEIGDKPVELSLVSFHYVVHVVKD